MKFNSNEEKEFWIEIVHTYLRDKCTIEYCVQEADKALKFLQERIKE